MNENIGKKGMSKGAKWGIGCGIGCMSIIIILAVAGFIAFKVVKTKIDEMEAELKSHGFEHVVKGQMLEISEDITKPELFMGQVVKIMGDCNTNLAVMSQLCEIHGKIDGDFYFRGQLLTIQPNAVIEGNLDIKAQALQNYGKVNGKITGTYSGIKGKE